jgi:hypothetical protein
MGSTIGSEQEYQCSQHSRTGIDAVMVQSQLAELKRFLFWAAEIAGATVIAPLGE